MLFDLANILVFLGLTVVFVAALLAAGRLVRPDIPEHTKSEIYECGEPAVGGGRIQFNFRFYLVAIVFIIFDVEIAFMFPVATVFRRWAESGRGALALGEVLVFVLVLFVGLIYVWAKGDLRWFKSIPKGGPS